MTAAAASGISGQAPAAARPEPAADRYPWPCPWPWLAVMVIWLSTTGATAAMCAWLPLEALMGGYGWILVVAYVAAGAATAIIAYYATD